MFDVLLHMLTKIFECLAINLKLGFQGTFVFEGTIFLQSLVHREVASLSDHTHRV